MKKQMGSREFGEHLKGLIGDAGLTVKMFSEVLGVNIDTPQKWFSGESYPHRKYHKKMSEILNVSIERLLMMKVGDEKSSVVGRLPAMELISKATMEVQKDMDLVLMQ